MLNDEPGRKDRGLWKDAKEGRLGKRVRGREKIKNAGRGAPAWRAGQYTNILKNVGMLGKGGGSGDGGGKSSAADVV